MTPSVNISNYNDNFTFSFVMSDINSSIFFLELNYSTKISTILTYILNISFNELNNLYFELEKRIVSIILLPEHNCLTKQYFDVKSSQCKDKFLININWNYVEQANILEFPFTEINPNIEKAINQEFLIKIQLDSFQYPQDFSYSFTITSNTLILYLNYKTSAINGIFLHFSLNQSIYKLLNYQNKSSYLIDSNYDIKLPEYYFLSKETQNTINQTASFASFGDKSTIASVYASILMMPGSSFAVRGFLLLNIIQLLRYLEINYPPNTVSVFSSKGNAFIIKEKVIDNKEEGIPINFTKYNISSSIFNNLIDDIVFMILMILMGLLIFWLKDKIKHKILVYLFIIAKIIFVWTMAIMMMLSKYLKISFFLFIFLRFKFSEFSNIVDFLLGILCFLYVVFLPIHFYKLIKKITLFPEIEMVNKIQSLNKRPELPQLKINICKILPEKGSELKQKNLELDEKISEIPEEKNSEVNESKEIVKEQPELSNSMQKSSKNHMSESFFDQNLLNPDVLLIPRRSCLTENSSEIDKVKKISSEINESFPKNYSFYDITKPKKSSELFRNLSNSPQKNFEGKTATLKEKNEDLLFDSVLRDKNPQRISLKFEMKLPDKRIMENSEDFKDRRGSLYEKNSLVFDKIKENEMVSGVFDKKSDDKNDQESETRLNIPESFVDNLMSTSKEIKDIMPFSSMEKHRKKKTIAWNKYVQTILLGVAKPFIFVINWIKHKHFLTDQKQYNFNYRILVKGVKKNKGIIKYYFVLDLFRYLFLTFFVIMLLEFPLAQIIILELICLAVLLFAIVKRPFESKIDMLLYIVNESLINCSYIAALILAVLDRNRNLDIETRMNLGWTIVFSYMFLMYSLIFNMVQRFIRLCFFYLKKFIVNNKKNT